MTTVQQINTTTTTEVAANSIHLFRTLRSACVWIMGTTPKTARPPAVAMSSNEIISVGSLAGLVLGLLLAVAKSLFSMSFISPAVAMSSHEIIDTDDKAFATA